MSLIGANLIKINRPIIIIEYLIYWLKLALLDLSIHLIIRLCYYMLSLLVLSTVQTFSFNSFFSKSFYVVRTRLSDKISNYLSHQSSQLCLFCHSNRQHEIALHNHVIVFIGHSIDKLQLSTPKNYLFVQRATTETATTLCKRIESNMHRMHKPHTRQLNIIIEIKLNVI